VIFKRRRRTDPRYLRDAEEILRELGWRRVAGRGSESIWTTATGAEWLPFEAAIDELALRAAPDPPEERWI
jgi:hypothetical protein